MASSQSILLFSLPPLFSFSIIMAVHLPALKSISAAFFKVAATTVSCSHKSFLNPSGMLLLPFKLKPTKRVIKNNVV